LGFPSFGVNEEIVAKGGNAEVFFALGVEVEFACGGGEDLDDQDGRVGLEGRGREELIAMDGNIGVEGRSVVWGDD
jgi:hypothetical protein